jgi:hypothetical protein
MVSDSERVPTFACPGCGTDQGDVQPGRVICSFCGARFDAWSPKQKTTSPFRQAPRLMAELSLPPTTAIEDLSTPERPRDLLIRRAGPYPDPLVFFSFLFVAVLLFLGGALLTRIGSGFGVAEVFGLACVGLFTWTALWPAMMHLWGQERIWLDGESLWRRRSVGRVRFVMCIPAAAFDGWDIEGAGRSWPGEDGEFLAIRRFGDLAPMALALGMRLERSHLVWLARHLESGIRLVRGERE